MRHGDKVNNLKRTTAHRHALMSNMAASLIMNKRINTTLAKAKALRVYVEPIITRSKTDSQHNRRQVFSYLQNKEAVTELFKEIGPKVGTRPGGYTRIIRYSITVSSKPTAKRRDDGADMCLIELVDYNEVMLANKGEKKAKTTRRGRGKTKKAEEGTATETTTEEPKSE